MCNIYDPDEFAETSEFPWFLQLLMQAIGSAAHKCSVVSFHAAHSVHFCLHCTNFATNTRFVLYEWAWRPLRCTHGNQSFIFLDMPLWTYLCP